MTALLIGSEIYRGSSYGQAHPLAVPRVSTVLDLSRALGWLPADLYRQSPRALPTALLAWHSPAYIAALQKGEAQGSLPDDLRARHGLGTLSNPIFGQMYRRPATGVGGVMLAAELVLAGGVVHVPGGGTHHGMPDRANGFCYLNDPVLCLLTLRRLGLQRVAYVDIDAHHPDGVEHGFAGDPQALLISVHEDHRWPFTGALADDGGGNCYNLPVPAGFNDTEMRAALDTIILPLVQRFAPEVLVVQCGADGLSEDPLSRLALSNRAHREVVGALRRLCPRLIVLGGGGYNPWSVARCWTGIWGLLSGREVPDDLPPDAREILAALTWSRLRGPLPEAWVASLSDPPREGPVRAEVRERIATLARRRPSAGDAMARG